MSEQIDQLVQKTQAALEAFASYSQEQVDAIVEAMVEAGHSNAETLGEMAYDETQMGVAAHKIAKNITATKVVGDYLRGKKSVGIIAEEDGIVQIAEPYGVVVALTPTTNPTSTVLFKAIISLKGRNTVIFAFHPRAQKSGVKTAKLMLDAAVKAGAPENCIQWVEQPSLDATNYLMTHPGVSLILATGGSAMVKAAYSSGHPAYGVGPGNIPCYIEKSADIEKAVQDVTMSKTFDNGLICASEQNLIFDDQQFADKVLQEFQKNSAYIANKEEKARIAEVMFDPETHLPNIDIVGKPAKKVAELAGFEVPADTKTLIVPLESVGADDPLSGEKLSPVLGYVVADSRKEAIDTAVQMLEYKGAGHSATMFSSDDKAFEEYFVAVPANRVLLNQPSVLGAVGGEYNNLKPTFTLGCGTQGGNSISDNLQYDHLLNIKRAAKPK